jgi:hypothetical protein
MPLLLMTAAHLLPRAIHNEIQPDTAKDIKKKLSYAFDFKGIPHHKMIL